MLWLAAAVIAAPSSAQTVEGSKPLDNVYIGVNGGVATKATGVKWMDNLNANAGLRIGKWITPSFGLALDGSAYFSNKPWCSTGTGVRASNVSLLGTVNFTNLFGGYPGEPRNFEVVGLYGLGWGRLYTSCRSCYEPTNKMTSKAGIDFTFNFGSARQWQFFIEPSVTWAFLGANSQPGGQPTYKLSWSDDQPRYNVNNAIVQLNAGIVYKFRNSSGSHNFRLYRGGVVDNSGEIDRLNAIINDLRAQLDQKPREVVKEVVREVQVGGKEVRVENLVFVTFAQGKSLLTKEAMEALNGVKAGSHVQIVGTASPEGSPELNQRLSQARADAVAAYLRDRGVIVDEALGKGVQGNTSNLLAVIYVK